MNSVIKLDSVAQAHIQAYWEYKNIVGDTDGGKLLSEEEFARRKKKALKDAENRLYVTWINELGLECRAVGPSSKCMCSHKFRDHDSCNQAKKVRCNMKKCKCTCFEYIPIRGSQDLKCHCKHSYKLHDVSTRMCAKRHPVRGVCHCSGFISSFGCACGQPYSAHRTIFETREERQKAGKRVDDIGSGMLCPAAGGVTSFSSLLDGVDRIMINPPQRTKLTEQQEMNIYATKYDNKPSNHPTGVNSKLKLLKRKRTRKSTTSSISTDNFESSIKMHPYDMCQIEDEIKHINRELEQSGLSAAKKYALNKKLKVEQSKIIRIERKQAQEKRRFDAAIK